MVQLLRYVRVSHSSVSVVHDVSVNGIGGRLAEDEHADRDHEDSIKHQCMPAAEEFQTQRTHTIDAHTQLTKKKKKNDCE